MTTAAFFSTSESIIDEEDEDRKVKIIVLWVFMTLSLLGVVIILFLVAFIHWRKWRRARDAARYQLEIYDTLHLTELDFTVKFTRALVFQIF